MTLNATVPGAPTLIHIQGRAAVSTVAERAELDVRVCDTGLDKDAVSKNVVNAVNTIQSELDQLCPRLENGDISPDAPITFYSIASLSISVGDDYDSEGYRPADSEKKLYTADSTIDVHFRDFSTLSEMVVRLSSMKYVGLRGIDWQLTDAKRAWLGEEVQMKALKHAMERAQAYARVIGREKVTCVKIEDPEEYWPTGRVKQSARRVTSSEAFVIGTGIEFEPRNVEINGKVTVEFHAE